MKTALSPASFSFLHLTFSPSQKVKAISFSCPGDVVQHKYFIHLELTKMCKDFEPNQDADQKEGFGQTKQGWW